MNDVLFGRIRLLEDGRELAVKEGWKFGGIGGFEAEAVLGHKVLGHVEKPVVPYAEGNLVASKNLNLTELHRKRNLTLISESYEDNGSIGKVLILEGARSVKSPEITDGNGETPMRFESTKKWREL